MADGEALLDGAEVPEDVEVVIRRVKIPRPPFGLVPGNEYRRATFAISEDEQQAGWTPPGFVPRAGLTPWVFDNHFECYVDGNTDTVGWGGPGWPEGVRVESVSAVFAFEQEWVDQYRFHIVSDGSTVDADGFLYKMRYGLAEDEAGCRRCAYVASLGEDTVPDDMLREFDVVLGPGIKSSARHAPVQPAGWFFAFAPWEAVDNVPMPPPSGPMQLRVYCFTGSLLHPKLKKRMVDSELQQRMASVQIMPDGSFALPDAAPEAGNADGN